MKKAGLLSGPILFLIILFFFHPQDLSRSGVTALAITVWVAVWWITEAIPIAATALIPLVLFPLTHALNIQESAQAFANPIVFLFMGGFMIAVAIEKWNLHKRIALYLILWIGSDLRKIILGFMVATAFISMWISNTATAVMMMPIGIAMVKQLTSGRDKITISSDQLGQATMLAIAYSSSIGGMATIIGTPTNLVFVGVIDELYNMEVSFYQWMLFAVPISVILLYVTWRYLVKYAFRLPGGTEIEGSRKEIANQLKALGPISVEEKRVMIVFVLVALAWLTRTLVLQRFIPGMNDASIAIAGALILFIMPAKRETRILDWATAESIPWGVIILLGGGLTLAAGFSETGLANWIGEQLTLFRMLPYYVLIIIIIFLVNFLTEITSNVATTSMILPVLAALALSIGVHPTGLMVAATVAASCAFMLPVATPPNAVVFGSGFLTIAGMVRVGIWMNLLSIFLLHLIVYFYLPIVWNLDLGTFPEFLK